MKPPPFAYHVPRDVAEAVGLLSTLENARVLAGGQSLMPMMNMRFVLPDHVIDINRIRDLAYIREAAGALELGAMTRQRDIETSELVRRLCPLLSAAVENVGHRQTRNRGTIGGSLCHLDPAAELAAAAAALDAVMVIAGPYGRREMPFAAFAQGFMSPALQPNEMLVGIRFPVWRSGHGVAFLEFARRHGDFAIVSVSAVLHCDANGRIERAALAIGGATPVPTRLGAVEAALIGKRGGTELFGALSEGAREIEAIEDPYATADYRRRLATVLTRRALDAAFKNATGAAR
jgi:carbon-monoxide dehydrogenase medium subunit